MERNKILYFARFLTRFILILCFLFFTILVITIIYWHADPKAFSNVDVTHSFKAGFGVNNIRILFPAVQASSGTILLSDLNHAMIYWLFIRASLFLLLATFIIKRILLILKSIHNLTTFYSRNIRHFQEIASYAFLAFLLSCFNFSYLEGQFNLSIDLPFAPLSFAVSALVLAEIFKEGKQLLEDQNMII